MRTVLTIGREPDNDLIINLPVVSGHHARVTWDGVPGRAWIEDLGSSNGTAIGQVDRKISRSVLVGSDLVYFGNHPVPGSELLGWVDPSMAPSLLMHGSEMVVGRDPDCHRVINRATVSGRHARFRRVGERIILEDLGSSNGTFINGQRVEGSAEVRTGDLIGLGVDSFRLATGPSAVASTRRMDALEMADSPRPTPTVRFELLPQEAGAWSDPAMLGALLAQGPILAAAISFVSRNVATTSFLMGLAAVWFGLSTAILGLLLDPARWALGLARSWAGRLAILACLGVIECQLAGCVALAMGSLKGSGLAVFGLLILASGVGLAVGTLIVLIAPGRTIAWSGLAGVVVALGLFGGGPASLPRTAPLVRWASNAAPSRWAFEGLLVNESESLNLPETDPAEAYFPAATDRMGASADALALGSMLVGLAGLGVFLVKFSATDR